MAKVFKLKVFGKEIFSYGSLPDGSLPDGIPGRQTKFLSPRYEPSNISQNATVMAVQNAIRQAENGDTQELYRFYRDVLLGDDHIQSCLNTRKLAVLAQPLAILPADKTNADDVALAAALMQARCDCENWQAGMLALMSACWWPNAIVERLYKPAVDSGRKEVPKLQYTLRKFVPVNYQLHCYQWAYLMGGVGLGTASAVQLGNLAGKPGGDVKDAYTIDLEQWEPYLKLWPIDSAGRIIYDVSNAEYLDPARHIVHRGHLLQDMRDNWGGPARATLMWWIFRGLGREWFARGMERYAQPFPVMYTDVNDPVAVSLMREALDMAKKIGGLVVSEDSRVELKEALVAGMAQGYDIFLTKCNDAISYHLTGLRSADKPAGLNAGDSNFNANVREDIRMFDQTMLGETCERQIAQPFAAINGLKGKVKFVWGGLSDVDAKAFADLLLTMSQAGLQLADESLPMANERTGLTWERAAAPENPNSNHQNPNGDDPIKDLRAARLTWLSVRQPVSSPIDPVVAAHSAALGQVFRGALAPVRLILLSSTSRADAENKLAQHFADWPAERIADLVEQAMQVCAAKGTEG